MWKHDLFSIKFLIGSNSNIKLFKITRYLLENKDDKCQFFNLRIIQTQEVVEKQIIALKTYNDR